MPLDIRLVFIGCGILCLGLALIGVGFLIAGWS